MERPIAGGHLLWMKVGAPIPGASRSRWSCCSASPCPSPIRRTIRVLDDMMRHPRVREYLLQHYVELAGSSGRVLVDARRMPTGDFGMLGFPCFR